MDSASKTSKSEQSSLPSSQTPNADDMSRPFQQLRKQIDHVFEEFGAGSWHLPWSRASAGTGSALRPDWLGSMVPAVDLAEKEDGYEISVELPGLDEKDIEISCANDNLVIKGEKKEEREEKKKDYYLSERRYGTFQRSFRIPSTVDAEGIEASFRKGVLNVRLPKRPEMVKPAKKIEVKGE